MKHALAILLLSASVVFGQPTLANSDDLAAAKNRANHTGTQAHTTITGLGTAATEDSVAVTPCGDTAGTPAFGYALERILSTYVGACIRVRRSSDSTELDIGFNLDGTLDTGSLLEFCGSGNGLIRTWYDQSGNARHLQQATTTKQPSVVSSGVLVTLNNKPAAQFTAASAQNMQASAFTLAGATAATAIAVFSPTDATTAAIIFDHGAPYTTGGLGVSVNQFGAGRVELLMGSASAATRLINYSTGYTAGAKIVFSGVMEPAASTDDLRGKMRINLSEVNEAQTGVVGTISTGMFLSDVLTVGSSKGSLGYFGGKIAMMAAWASKNTTEQLASVETQAMRGIGMATPYGAIPSSFDETGVATQDADFIRASAFANTTWTTRATVLKIHHSNDIYTSFPNYAGIVVKVDGEFYQQSLAAANGLTTSTVFLPAGLKTVEIVSGLQSRPGAVGTTVYGTHPISFASNAPMDRVTVAQSNRLVIYGDSISVGANATIAARDGWAMLVRGAASYRAAFVAKIVAWNPAKFWMCIGTNDYGLNRWTAANFGTAYAALLDDLHTALPSMQIYCQTPLLRSVETANGSGSTLGNYRTQITTAVSTRAWATLVDGTAIMTTGSLADGVHPTDAGHVLYAAAVKTVLGIP